jgi:signal-transduction protein with cAMP-binding, CBS, and nucleotidyltransferase domain
MTSPIITIDIHAPLSAAIDLLDGAHVTGLIVTDEAQPIGIFTQSDALASRNLPRSTPIEATYDARVVTQDG